MEEQNLKNPQEQQCNINVVSERLIEFGIWLQDNYSQNRYANDKHIMLPKGQMRKDFTDDIYTIAEIVTEFNAR